MFLVQSRRAALRAFLTIGVSMVFASTAQASFHQFRITEVYSNADGTIQFIELRESFGADFEHFFNGVTITSNSKSYTFNANLPSEDTSGRHVLLATHEFSHLSSTPLVDFEIPDRFFDPAGDTLNFGFFTDVVTFGAMPANPNFSLNRSGGSFIAGPNTPTNFAGTTGAVPEPASAALALLTGALLARSRRPRH